MVTKKEEKVKNIDNIVKCSNAVREAVGLDGNGASISRLSIFRQNKKFKNMLRIKIILAKLAKLMQKRLK